MNPVPDCGEDVGQVGAGPLDAVAVVNASLPGLRVAVKSVKVVVKVHVSRAQMSKQTRMKSEIQGIYFSVKCINIYESCHALTFLTVLRGL